ncbi:MAG: hypothetical protein ILM98_06865 [Kiritimatiellae bacterium]|nr:hypothetical protein [Kiritimatiellia bacterium]
MNYKSILIAASALATLCAAAADFPSAGGDIASNGADGWNGAKPGSGEEAKFTQAGTYTASGDVTFGSVNFASDGLVFDLRSGNRTVTLDGATPVVGPTAANATTHLKGGSWSGTGMALKNSDHIGEGYTLMLTDGAVIMDAGTFSPGWGLKNNSIVLTGGSEIHANNFYLHQWPNTGTRLDVGDGSKVYTTSAFMVQTSDADAPGYHLVDIHGAGSLLHVGGDLNVGQRASHNTVRVRDGAKLEVTTSGKSLEMGSGWVVSDHHVLEILNSATGEVAKIAMNRGDNRVTVSNAVLSATELLIGNTTRNQGGNVVEVLDEAEATVGTTTFYTSGNSLLVSNATYTVGTGFSLGSAATVTGNVVRVEGSDSTFNFSKNLFGSGCNNTFELANGAAWRLGGANIMSMMDGGSNNVLRVTGGAVLDNTSEPAGNSDFWLNYENNTWENNTLEILNVATVKVERLFVHGVGTKIVVSNATLQASATGGYGIWLGRGSGSSGQKLIVQGATPRVILNEYKSSTGSALRFEIPAEGYADGYVPVTARVLNPSSTATEKFEIDCAAWAAKTGGKLTLIRAETAFSQNAKDWIAEASDLPSDCELVIENNDHDLVLRSPSKAATVIYMR